MITEDWNPDCIYNIRREEMEKMEKKELPTAFVVNKSALEKAFDPYVVRSIKHVKIAKDASAHYDPKRPKDFFDGFIVCLQDNEE